MLHGHNLLLQHSQNLFILHFGSLSCFITYLSKLVIMTHKYRYEPNCEVTTYVAFYYNMQFNVCICFM